jgi:protein-S-isoprenylcysteine O-methyltransferase Ste14
LHLDIEKSIKFFEKHAPTLAMIYEFMGAEEFDKFIQNNLQVGKRKMGARHRAILSNAKALGFTFGVGVASFLLFLLKLRRSQVVLVVLLLFLLVLNFSKNSRSILLTLRHLSKLI